MTGPWNLGAKTIAYSTGGLAVGLFVSFGIDGAQWLAPILTMAMIACAFSTVPFALVYVMWLRLQRSRILGRDALTDGDFIARMPTTLDQVDPLLVHQIRQLARTHFRSIGGAKFYPNDRLEGDLHLCDTAPFASEEFFDDVIELATLRGMSEDDEHFTNVETIADLIIAINQIRSKQLEG